VRLDGDKREVHLKDGEILTADILINTVHVDRLFGMQYGELQYCGRDFIPIWLPIKNALPEDLTWIHYSGVESHTRVTEFKKITDFKSDSTLLGIEIPSKNGRYYPVQSQPELKRFEQYKSLFPKDFYSIGRMGKFQYQGIPDAIRDALNLAEKLK
jgi:UDP-galactopyranose mutase